MDTLNNENFPTFETKSNEEELLQIDYGRYKVFEPSQSEVEINLLDAAIREVQSEKEAIRKYLNDEINLACLNVEMDGEMEIAIFSMTWDHKDLIDDFLQKLYGRLDDLEKSLQEDKNGFYNEEDWFEAPMFYAPYLPLE